MPRDTGASRRHTGRSPQLPQWQQQQQQASSSSLSLTFHDAVSIHALTTIRSDQAVPGLETKDSKYGQARHSTGVSKSETETSRLWRNTC